MLDLLKLTKVSKIILNLFTTRYSWNTVKVGVKHQSINIKLTINYFCLMHLLVILLMHDLLKLEYIFNFNTIRLSTEVKSTTQLQTRGRFTSIFGYWLFWSLNTLLWVTVKCRTTIQALFLYFNLCLSVMLDGLSCSYIHISFLANQEHFGMTCSISWNMKLSNHIIW